MSFSNMKQAASILILQLSVLFSFAQFESFFTVRTLAHANFLVKAPSLDDAGGGFGIDIGLFSKNRLMLVTTIHYDRFICDKSMTIPDVGRVNKGGTVYGVQAGPEYHLTKRVAVSVT